MCRMHFQGRSSAAFTTLITVFLLLNYTQAARYVVGDSSGWGFGMGNWTGGKNFKAGDILIFKYDPSLHNVVVVDAKGYNGCTASAKAKSYSSGNDGIKLSKGKNYFICSLPGHCDGGIKMLVNAS